MRHYIFFSLLVFTPISLLNADAIPVDNLGENTVQTPEISYNGASPAPQIAPSSPVETDPTSTQFIMEESTPLSAVNSSTLEDSTPRGVFKKMPQLQAALAAMQSAVDEAEKENTFSPEEVAELRKVIQRIIVFTAEFQKSIQQASEAAAGDITEWVNPTPPENTWLKDPPEAITSEDVAQAEFKIINDNWANPALLSYLQQFSLPTNDLVNDTSNVGTLSMTELEEKAAEAKRLLDLAPVLKSAMAIAIQELTGLKTRLGNNFMRIQEAIESQITRLNSYMWEINLLVPQLRGKVFTFETELARRRAILIASDTDSEKTGFPVIV